MSSKAAKCFALYEKNKSSNDQIIGLNFCLITRKINHFPNVCRAQCFQSSNTNLYTKEVRN